MNIGGGMEYEEVTGVTGLIAHCRGRLDSKDAPAIAVSIETVNDFMGPNYEERTGIPAIISFSGMLLLEGFTVMLGGTRSGDDMVCFGLYPEQLVKANTTGEVSRIDTPTTLKVEGRG